MKRTLIVALCGITATALTNLAVSQEATKSAHPQIETASPEAVARARKTVQMLDDVYKSAIVLITSKYVKNERDYPAGRAAKKWFEDITKKGWHGIRIIDVSGEPYNADNVAKDDFEKSAVAKLKQGKGYFDQVVQKDGKPFLRAMTAIPVVMDRCVMCHPNYTNAKQGEAIGALSYTVPIE